MSPVSSSEGEAPGRHEAILGAFDQSDLFSKLDPDARLSIAGSFRERSYGPDEFLLHQGQPADVFHLVGEGRVKVVQTSVEGLEVILHIFEPGGLIGALPTIGEGLYPASAVAMEVTRTYVIDAQDFDQILVAHPQIAANLLKFASRMLQTAHNRLRELATERVERRIARTLTRLLRQMGVEQGEAIVLERPLTRQDLAELSGTTLFTISRTLKAWERQGLIRAERERVVVLRPHQLVAIAEDLPD